MKRSLNLIVLAALLTLSLGAMSGIDASAKGLPAPATALQFFSNPATITINDGAATPYPSQIAVAVAAGAVITDVDVTLNTLNHNYAEDINVLLVGPQGQTVMLMSDVDALEQILSGETYTFDDSAPGPLSPTSIDLTGSYQPSDYADTCGNDSFPGLVPVGPYGATMSVFNGTNPNGNWDLYVVDDCTFDTGAIVGGWSIAITFSAPAVSLSNTSFDFGDVLVGQTSASQTLTITNTGNTTLDFTGTSLNTHPPFNINDSSCGGFLNAGDSCYYEFSFTTYSAGLVNGDFTFTSDAAGSPHVISLSGNGVVVPPSGTNLLKKPDFATANIFPTPWKLFGVNPPYASALDCSVFQLASCSVYFPSGNRSAMQQVNRSGLAGDMYLFGLSSMANNAGGKYLVEVTFYNNLNKPMGGTGMWFNSGTHGWQTLSGFATASGNYNKIIFRFYYQNPTGRAWFDDAFLMVAP